MTGNLRTPADIGLLREKSPPVGGDYAKLCRIRAKIASLLR